MTYSLTITDLLGTRIETYPTLEMAERAYRVLTDYSETNVTKKWEA
jgi:hypothetical protein